ncbi:MAG: alkyl sulfatase dimerization domain-containing protein [Mycobacterium sp.]|nr:alkyl sulfatase dimerization domain-containing protein [Mycobacterium sp.]
MAGIHRERPGAEDLAAATGEPARALGDGIWMSEGVSNSYAVETDAGRVLINTGLFFEAPLRLRAFEHVAGTTQSIIVTQGHADHWGGVNALRDADSDVIMQENYRYWRDDHERLMPARASKTSFAFKHFTDSAIEYFQSTDPAKIDLSFPEPTATFGDRLEVEISGRTFQLAATPGGETTDSLVVWLPDVEAAFTGNLFGPLFGHVPNLMTIRGDRYRDPMLYIESLNTVLDFAPKRLITGHFDPIDGRDRIAEEITAMRDAMQSVHDQTVELMNAGGDVHTAMGTVRIPEKFDIGEGYGRTVWNVRAIWEMYAGWFHHRSTTELYSTDRFAVAPDVVAAAGSGALVEVARSNLVAGRPVRALHLTDLVLAAEPDNSAAREAAAQAHEQLLAQAENFWERAWLTKSINELRERG